MRKTCYARGLDGSTTDAVIVCPEGKTIRILSVMTSWTGASPRDYLIIEATTGGDIQRIWRVTTNDQLGAAAGLACAAIGASATVTSLLQIDVVTGIVTYEIRDNMTCALPDVEIRGDVRVKLESGGTGGATFTLIGITFEEVG